MFKKGHPFYKGGEKSWFKKGQKSWNAGKKAPWVRNNPQTFKKGMIPWNKGLKCPQLSGKNNPNWKGGKWKHKAGYWCIYTPNHPNNSKKYVFRSRLVTEECLGRYIRKGEIVHHINRIRDDDRPENLYLFNSQDAHIKFHFDPYKLKSNLL